MKYKVIAFLLIICLLPTGSYSLAPQSDLLKNRPLSWFKAWFDANRGTSAITSIEIPAALAQKGTKEAWLLLFDWYQKILPDYESLGIDSRSLFEIRLKFLVSPLEYLVEILLDERSTENEIKAAANILFSTIDLTLLAQLKAFYLNPTTEKHLSLRKSLISDLINEIPKNLLAPQSNGHFESVLRITWKDRYSDLNKELMDEMLPLIRPRDPNEPIQIADVGVADGRTTLELALALDEKGIPFQMVGTDLHLFPEVIRTKDRRFQLVLSSKGKPQFYKVNGYLHSLKNNQNFRDVPEEITRLFGYWTAGKNLGVPFPLHVEKATISLVYPEAEEYARKNPHKLQFFEQDAWEPFNYSFDLIRVMSLMVSNQFSSQSGINAYFTEQEVLNGLKNLGRALKKKRGSDSGILVGANSSELDYYDFYLLKGRDQNQLEAQDTPFPFVSHIPQIGSLIAILEPDPLILMQSTLWPRTPINTSL